MATKSGFFVRALMGVGFKAVGGLGIGYSGADDEIGMGVLALDDSIADAGLTQPKIKDEVCFTDIVFVFTAVKWRRRVDGQITAFAPT